MRIGISTLLFILSSAWVADAQPPVTPPDPGKLIIRPGGKGAVPFEALGREPGEKAGFIVIRPGGNSTPRPSLDDPRQPTLIAGTPANSSLNVPPPGASSKDTPESFDYWFAVGVEGQRVGYVNWSAKEMQQKDKSFVRAFAT